MTSSISAEIDGTSSVNTVTNPSPTAQDSPTTASASSVAAAIAGTSNYDPTVATGSATPTPGVSSAIDAANDYIETLTASVDLLKKLHAFSFVAHAAHVLHAFVSRRRAHACSSSRSESDTGVEANPKDKKEECVA